MTAYARLAATALEVHPSSTSYFSEPEQGLDPTLFTGMHMRPAVRQKLLGILYGFLRQHFSDPETWATLWLAGSGASYQWSADRDPGDLDMLIGVDFPQFRRSNRDLVDLGDAEISGLLNKALREGLSEQMKTWEP